MKKILFNILKITGGFIFCRIIIGVINYLIGIILFELSVNEIISINRMAELFNLFIIIYLPLLVVVTIGGIIIGRDYLKGNKSNILWKLIVLILCYVSFEFVDELVIKRIQEFIMRN